MPERVAASKPPVFIVGAPRSGTTLLRNLLSRHPALAISGETRFYGDVYKRRWLFGDLSNLQNRRRLVEQYLATRRVQQLGVDLDGLKQKLLREATSYRELFAGILQYYADSQGKTRYGEKTPHHAFFTERLSEWFPGASIIHLVRDPRAVVASLQNMPWAAHSIVNNAWMWRLFNRAARRSSHRSGYLLVHYEALSEAPEQELARICAHLGEDYVASMLPLAEPGVNPYSWPRSAAGPVTTQRLETWRERLSAEDVSLIEWIAGRDMSTYGYPHTSAAPTIPAIIRGLARAAFDPLQRLTTQLPYLWFCLLQPTRLAKQEYWKYRNAWEKTATFSDLPSWNE
jgi:hypothetical protein